MKILHLRYLPVLAAAVALTGWLLFRAAMADAEDAGAAAVAAELSPASPCVVAATPRRSGYSAEDWAKILTAFGVAIGSIGGLWVTITGNRAAAARDAAAARAAELRAEQLRAVATRVDAPVIAAPQEPVSGEVVT